MKRRISVVLAVVVLSVVVGGCKNETSEQTTETEGVRKAPEFTLTSFDGKEVNLSDYKGKVVVLEWLNTSCPFVIHHYESAKTMVSLAEKYKDVVWLAINSTNHTTPQQNKDFRRQGRQGGGRIRGEDDPTYVCDRYQGQHRLRRGD